MIGRQEELARRELTADAIATGWPIRPRASSAATAKIRYNSPPAAATADLLPDNRLHVTFDEPRHGVAPGQAVVLYDGERVLGGGWIE